MHDLLLLFFDTDYVISFASKRPAYSPAAGLVVQRGSRKELEFVRRVLQQQQCCSKRLSRASNERDHTIRAVLLVGLVSTYDAGRLGTVPGPRCENESIPDGLSGLLVGD
jgi:hypothetical protein